MKKNWFAWLLVAGCILTQYSVAGAAEKYSESSVLLKKANLAGASQKTDAKTSEGIAICQPSKASGWSVQWDGADFISKLKPGKEYVFRIRLRPEFQEPPAEQGSFLTIGFYNGKEGKGGFKAKYDAYDDGEYRDFIPCRIKIVSPDLQGYFYCSPQETQLSYNVWYDFAEFIPVDEFKDQTMLKSIPLFEL